MVFLSDFDLAGLRSFRDDIRKNNLTSVIVNDQGRWDNIVTPALLTMRKLGTGEELSFEDVFALAESSLLPRSCFQPPLDIDSATTAKLFILCSEEDDIGLKRLNNALGLTKLEEELRGPVKSNVEMLSHANAN